ncbi:hypothetical protein Tco_1540340 [Tanacetum coccineum]
MAQQQQQRDVPQNQLCPPNKHFDLMDANMKFDLVTPQCPNETIDNNNDGFVDAPTFSQMVTFFLKDLGFSLRLRSPSNFMSKGLSQPWHTLFKNDDLVKNIFNSGKNKEGEWLLIPEWMLTEEMMLTDHCQIAPRPPNIVTTEGESSAQRKPTVIRFRIPRRPDTKTPISTAAEIDITNLDETIQMSIAKQRSIKDFEAQQNVEKVKDHMVDEELEQLREGTENVDVDAFMDDVFNRGESAGDEFELRRRENGKGIEDIKDPTPIRSPMTYISLISLDKEILQELTVTTEDAPSCG